MRTCLMTKYDFMQHDSWQLNVKSINIRTTASITVIYFIPEKVTSTRHAKGMKCVRDNSLHTWDTRSGWVLSPLILWMSISRDREQRGEKTNRKLRGDGEREERQEEEREGSLCRWRNLFYTQSRTNVCLWWAEIRSNSNTIKKLQKHWCLNGRAGWKLEK